MFAQRHLSFLVKWLMRISLCTLHLKKLQETKGNTTFGELFDYVRTQVAQKSIVVNEKSQTPSVNASGELTSTWKQSKLF